MSIHGPIERFMSEDHAAIAQLLAASEAHDGVIDPVVYALFRARLLRHIAMEEKVLLPDARARRGGEPLALATALRRDHGEIARLLVPSPSPEGIKRLREVLDRHNAVEEGSEGLYAACDALAGGDVFEVVERLRRQPRVPLAPHYDGPAHKMTGS